MLLNNDLLSLSVVPNCSVIITADCIQSTIQGPNYQRMHVIISSSESHFYEYFLSFSGPDNAQIHGKWTSPVQSRTLYEHLGYFIPEHEGFDTSIKTQLIKG